MTVRGRKYGDRPSHPTYVWNGLLEAKHRKRIGEALWEFLWCLDRITQERDGVGLVLGGKPVACKDVADGFDVNERTVRRHFDQLERESYIERTLAPHGYTIRVRNSHKFRVKVVGQDCPTSLDKSVRRNKDKAVEEAAASVASPKPDDSVWAFLKIKPCGPLQFRFLIESRWVSRNGDRPSVVIGETIDAWEAAEGEKLRRAPQLFQALTELRKRQRRDEQKPVEHVEPIHTLTAQEIPA